MKKERHIVVTGASSGIGEAITKELAGAGVSLYVCARRGEKLKAITGSHSLRLGHTCDVSDENQVREFVDRVRELTPHIDVLINCAGVLGGIGPLVKTDSNDWRKTIEVNLYGTYLMCKYVVPMMSVGRQPRIINFSGGGAFGPFPNYSAYGSSKAAVVSLTQTLSEELAGEGIMVNAVAPGFVATDIHQATLFVGSSMAGNVNYDETRRLLRGGSVPIERPVECVKFLLSDAARNLTGKTISANFDPWDQPEFAQYIDQINESDLYTQRRINLVNLPEDELYNALSSASARKS